MLNTLMLVLHVFAVIVWIGGVTFVTTVVFPMMYKTEGSLEKALLFQRIEHRFVKMVRWLIAIVGLTGVHLLQAKHGFGALLRLDGLPYVIMLFAWAVYLGVFLSERKLFARLFADPQKFDVDKALRMINVMHWVLLSLSYAAVAAGVWAGHIQ